MKRVKPFELRECKDCKTEYKHYSTNKYPLCGKCRDKFYNAKNRLTAEQRKISYPLDGNERRRRYTRMRRALDNCNNSEERRIVLGKHLEETIELQIYKWCVTIRDIKPPIEEGSKKVGRRPNSGDPKAKYPSTKDMPY